MKAFDLASTDDVISASRRAFGIAARDAIRRFYSTVSPLEGDGFACVLGALEGEQPVPDTPRMRHWVSTTRRMMQALEAGTDPDPTCVSHLYLDDLDGRRIHDLHSFRLAEAWVESRLRERVPFEIVLGGRAPRRFVLGSLGTIEFAEDREGALQIECDGSSVTAAADSARVAVHSSREHRASDEARFHVGTEWHHAVGSVEIPLHDSGLAEPYHARAAIVRGRRAVASWASVLTRAVDLLACVDSRIAQECLRLSPAMLPLHNGGISFGSASPEYLVGLTYLPAVKSADDLAECLLHEAMHQKLYRIEECTRLFQRDSPDDEAYYSPWRTDPRPLRMDLHGAYVFTGVAELWMEVVAWRGEGSAELAERVFLRARQASIALDVVSGHARLTDLGGRIVAGLREVLYELLANVEVAPASRSNIESRLLNHAERHASYIC